MEARKKHLYQSSLHGDQPVRLYADRVPTFTFAPSDVPESSKIVLNKHGWNSKHNFNGEQRQKSSDPSKSEESQPRSILRETNNIFNAGNYEWNILSHPLESGGGSAATICTSNGGIQNGRHFDDPHTDVVAAVVGRNEDSSLRLSNTNNNFCMDAGYRKINDLLKKDETFKPALRDNGLPLNDDLHSKLNSNDERPIFSATSMHDGNSLKGKNGRHLASEKFTVHDRNPHKRYDSDKAKNVKQAKLGLKVQLHKDHRDGLERLRQLVAKQRLEERDHRISGNQPPSGPSADCYGDILPLASDGQFLNLPKLLTSGKNVKDVSDIDSDGRGNRHDDLFGDGYTETRFLHRNDDPVQPNKKIKYGPKLVNIPRKVAQAPAPPSYKGFCEVGGSKVVNSGHGPLMLNNGKASASGHQPTSVTERSCKMGQAKDIEDSNRKRVHQLNGHAADAVLHLNHPTSNKNIYESVPKKLSKPNKTDIDVRSWRAGIRVVEQQLGKMPKMSLSPPTKGSVPDVSDTRNTADPSSAHTAEHSQKSDGGAAEQVNIFGSHEMVLDGHNDEVGNSGEKIEFGESQRGARNVSKHLEAEKYEEFDGETDDSKSDKTDAEHDVVVHKASSLSSRAKSVSLQKKKKKILDVTEEKEKERPMPRDRSYDKEEVKKFIAKQKAERMKKLKEELKEKQNADENRQRQLEALSRKQKESAGSRIHIAGKGKPRMGSRDNSTDTGSHRYNDVSSVEVSSSEERNFERFMNPTEDGYKIDRSREAKADEIIANFVETKVGNSLNKSDGENLTSNTTESSYAVQQNSRNREIINSEVSNVTFSSEGSMNRAMVPESQRNRSERLALLERAARSLSSRLNLERSTFVSAFNPQDSSSVKPSAVLERNFVTSISNVPVTRDALASVSHSQNEQRFEEAVDEDSDSTLTEESVARPEKPSSSVLPFIGDGSNSNVANISLKPSSHRVRGGRHERKTADIEKWITKRAQKDSNDESALTGSIISDAESESKDSVNSSSAILPVRLTESGVTAGPHSEYVLRLRMLQQSHRANMLSLQAKSRQDLILASRRPLMRNESSDSGHTDTRVQEVTSADVESIVTGAKAVTTASNANQMEDLELSKAQGDSFSFNYARSKLPSGVVFVQERAADNRSSMVFDTSGYQENENFLSGNAMKSPSETDLEASLTEEEMERSMRDILPSEKQIKKLRKHGSLTNVGPTVDQSSAKHIFGSESFDSFSLNMVRTYLTQEQSRMHHQHMLLKLREQALAEKTRAQLAWWEQQKLQRKKGSDDSYPAIRQKQKEIIEKHKKEKASLHILQNLARQALSMGHGSMSDLESIKFMQHAAQKIKQKIDSQNPKIRKWLDANSLTPRILSSDSDVTMSASSDPEQLSEGLKDVGYEYDDVLVPYSILPSENQQSIRGENAEIDSPRSPSLLKEEASTSLHSDVSHMPSPIKEKIAQKLKIQMDSRYLTIREKKLRQRRMDAEKLLAWKNRLDREEEEVRKLEMEASQKILLNRGTSVGPEPELAKIDMHDDGQNLVKYKDCCTSPIQSLSPASLAANHHHNGQLEQAVPVIAQNEPKRIPSTLEGPTPMADGKTLPVREFERKDSVDASPVTNTSAKQSKLSFNVNGIHTNEFVERISQKQRESVSETEDSFSAPLSETTTDQSELERQTKALQEELRRKRMKVENLRKQKRKEEMKAKEDCLKKQIELADEEIKKLSTLHSKHSEYSSAVILPYKYQPVLDPSLDELPEKIVSDTEIVSTDKRSDYSLEMNPESTKNLENIEEVSHAIRADSQRANGHVLIAEPKYDDVDAESDKSSKIIEPVKAASKLPSIESPGIVSEVDGTAFDKLEPSDGKSLGDIDVDDFFDMKVNDPLPSNNAFTVLNRRETDDILEPERQDEFDFEVSQKSVSSASVVSKKSHSELSQSVTSLKSNNVLKSDISDESGERHEVDSQASEKSIRSASSMKSDNLDRKRQMTEEIFNITSEKLKDDDSVSLENSIHSISSSASKPSQHSRDGDLHSDKSTRSSVSSSEKASDRQKYLNEKDEEDRSADSVKSSKKSSQLSKVSDISKKSKDSKVTASYSEDFSSTSRKQSKNDSPDRQLVEDDRIDNNDSEAEEVQTEDEINSSLSEDEGDKTENRVLSEIGLGKTAGSEIAPTKHSVEDVKDLTKNSVSSDDNILKEHLPEIPSETDLPNNSADQTLHGDENSLSGAGDSELERVISSAAAAVELFGSSEISSRVTKDASVESTDKRDADVITDNEMKNLVSEAVSEVLAIKSKKELSPEKLNLDQDDAAQLPKSPESAGQQRPPSSLPLFDNDWWDGEYLDDDFGWASGKPPPPYEQKSVKELENSNTQPATHIPEPVVRIPEPTAVVPHTSEEVLHLADEVVNIFWHLRRCGESWDDVQPTAEYFGTDASAATPEQSSRRMYKQVIFDAVAEFLQEMYHDEDSTENAKFFPFVPLHPMKWHQYYKEKNPPTTLDVLRPVVRSYVACTVGQQIALQKVPRKWLSRRKDDGVDRVLTKELHEEEPEWVSYEEDTVKIKFQLAESIFQILLSDAARTVASVYERIQTNEKSKS